MALSAGLGSNGKESYRSDFGSFPSGKSTPQTSPTNTLNSAFNTSSGNTDFGTTSNKLETNVRNKLFENLNRQTIDVPQVNRVQMDVNKPGSGNVDHSNEAAVKNADNTYHQIMDSAQAMAREAIKEAAAEMGVSGIESRFPNEDQGLQGAFVVATASVAPAITVGKDIWNEINNNTVSDADYARILSQALTKLQDQNTQNFMQVSNTSNINNTEQASAKPDFSNLAIGDLHALASKTSQQLKEFDKTGQELNEALDALEYNREREQDHAKLYNQNNTADKLAAEIATGHADSEIAKSLKPNDKKLEEAELVFNTPEPVTIEEPKLTQGEPLAPKPEPSKLELAQRSEIVLPKPECAALVECTGQTLYDVKGLKSDRPVEMASAMDLKAQLDQQQLIAQQQRIAQMQAIQRQQQQFQQQQNRISLGSMA